MGIIPVIPSGFIVYAILGFGVVLKLALYIYCIVANKDKGDSDDDNNHDGDSDDDNNNDDDTIIKVGLMLSM